MTDDVHGDWNDLPAERVRRIQGAETSASEAAPPHRPHVALCPHGFDQRDARDGACAYCEPARSQLLAEELHAPTFTPLPRETAITAIDKDAADRYAITLAGIDALMQRYTR